MIPHHQIDVALDRLDYATVKTNKKINYINLPCGFDIETTSIKIGEVKAAFSYIWMVGIGHDNGVYFGRTWAEFVDLCDRLQQRMGLSESNRLVVYVHNLGYEFQFMRKHFTWVDVFAGSERKPIKAVCTHGIEFRDNYTLSGFSLANTAKNLVKYKVKKMEGDLNYDLVRHHNTPLTEVEMGYCENDIAVITAYISEQIELYGDLTKIPTTNTGRVRRYVRDECYYSDKNHRKSSKGKYLKYRRIMGDLTVDVETYVQLKKSFMGGFTHANAAHANKTLTNVSSVDFTSSYPAVMVSEKFPMSRFKPVEIKTLSELKAHYQRFAMVFDARFTGLRAKLTQEVYISESKCAQLTHPVMNNGRVVSAELLATTITDVDFDIIQQVYEWDELEIANARKAHKAYLPKSIVKSILDLYQKKTVLKDVGGSEVEYLLSKGMLNSIYGMCVTDIVKDSVKYNGEWSLQPVDVLEEVDKYNGSKNRFLYYAWGIWVTAYARRNLWTGILAVGDDYVYSDTDSIKLLNFEKHQGYIDWYNTCVIEKMEKMCDEYKFDKALLSPKTKEGVVKTLGIWDFEGTHTRFKTLGAKRYMVEKNGKLTITVSGLSKQNGVNYMLEQCENDASKVFNMFTDYLYVPAERTGKMTHTYIDEEMQFQVVDYLGEKADITTLSAIHLEKCDFTLSIAQGYKNFLQNLANGYIFKGVKHV